MPGKNTLKLNWGVEFTLVLILLVQVTVSYSYSYSYSTSCAYTMIVVSSNQDCIYFF